MFQQSDLPMLHAMQDRARRITDMIHSRAIDAYCAAFGAVRTRDSHLDMCVIHNSLVDYQRGNPWREVNYSHMRRAKWLCERTYQPSRIVNAWYRRKCGIA